MADRSRVPLRVGDVLLVEWERTPARVATSNAKSSARWAVIEIKGFTPSIIADGMVYTLLVVDEDGFVKTKAVGLDELVTPWFYSSRRITRLG